MTHTHDTRGRPVAIWLAHAVVFVVLLVLDGWLADLWRSLDTEAFEQFVRVYVTDLGKGHYQAAVLLVLLAGASLLRRHALSGLCLRALAAVALAGVAANVLKLAFLRVRPSYGWADPHAWWGALAQGQSGSFPSADTATAFALAAIVGATVPRAGWMLYVVAATIGFGRFAIHCHWPSDVYIGALVGVVTGQWVLRRLRLRASRQAQEGSGRAFSPPG
jgi:undecaprenyl-diphosphatase